MTPRIIAVPLVAALSLAIAGTASAKVIESVQACGAGGCKDVTAAAKDESFFDFGPTSTSAPKNASFYRVNVKVGDGSGKVFEGWQFLFVPAADKVRIQDEIGRDQWFALPAARSGRLRAEIGDLRAHPGNRLPDTAPVIEPRGRVDEVFQPATDSQADAGSDTLAVVGTIGALLAFTLAGFALARALRARSARPGASTPS